MALIPDGPPRRFRWRGVTYEVAGAQGPERIGAEWWHLSAPPAPAIASARLQALTRDYYLVEDADGHRFWLYREGLYERETVAPRRKEKLVVTASSAYALIYFLTRKNARKRLAYANNPCTNQRAVTVSRSYNPSR